MITTDRHHSALHMSASSEVLFTVGWNRMEWGTRALLGLRSRYWDALGLAHEVAEPFGFRAQAGKQAGAGRRFVVFLINIANQSALSQTSPKEKP